MLLVLRLEFGCSSSCVYCASLVASCIIHQIKFHVHIHTILFLQGMIFNIRSCRVRVLQGPEPEVEEDEDEDEA